MWPEQRRAEWVGEPLVLTSTEFSVLELLLRHAGRKTIRIPFDKKTLSMLRAALQRGAPVTATIYGAILDPGGNVEAQTVGQKLRIRH